MVGIFLFCVAALVAISGAFFSMGPTTLETQADGQVQLIRRLALEAAGAARTRLLAEPGSDLTLASVPTPLPNPTVYGRRDLLAPQSSLIKGGHEWIPASRTSISASLPPFTPGTSVLDPRAYEVAVLNCVRAKDDTSGSYVTVLASNCPDSPSSSDNALGRVHHLLIIKTGWLGPATPTPTLDSNAIYKALRAEFGYVQMRQLEYWRPSVAKGGFDTFIIGL